MSNDKKVVQLRSPPAPTGPLPAVLADLYGKGCQYLADHVQKLLDNADDALFELADRAANSGEQNLYFEAMREIRVHRRRLEEEFRNQLQTPFHALMGSGRASGGALVPLELLDYDDMEEQVAVESMANKASKRFAAPLATIGQSLEQWSQANGNPVELNANNLPLSPLSVCDAFAKAARNLEISIKPKLVLFKLFDRHVVAELSGLYDELEKSLKLAGFYDEAGLEPHNRGSVDAPDQAGEAEHGETGAPADAADADAQAQQDAGTLFDILKGLLVAASSGAQGTAQQEAQLSSLPTGKIQLSKGSLMSVLQELQGSQLQRLATRGTHVMDANELTQLPADLAERLRGVSRDVLDESDETLAQRDFDVINLVSLLFQYILEDESLAGPMKGLIAHLQIPVLKAAMIDKRFFSKEGHPARLLLNTIADACLGWQAHGDCEDDPLYMEIDSVVKHILSSADGSPDTFQEALDEFKSYLEQERRKADIVTRRVLDAQDVKEAANAARKVVDQLVQEKLGTQPVPTVVRTLVEEGWSKVLFLQYVQQGADSEAWKSAVALIDNLLWSVQPVSSSAHRDKLLADLPTILDKLRTGLNQIGYNPYELKEQLQGLEQVHLERLKKAGGSAASGHTSVETVHDEPVPEVDLDALDASLAESLGETPAASGKELEEAERRLTRLQVGTWVELQQSDAKPLRCRLAAVIASTGRHIFVNRAGMKVAELEKDDMVRKLATDQLSMLDDSMLFDRALESVISNLRDMKDKPM